MVKLFSCVKFHQGVRIEMACGGRALALLNRAYEENRQVSQAFSAKIFETGDAARTMNRRLADAQYQVSALQKQIFSNIAQGYAGRGDVFHFQPDCAPGELRELADLIDATCGGTAFACSESEGRMNICLISHTDDLKALGAELKNRFQARGGGKPGSFQGTCQASAQELEEFFVRP